MGGVEGLLGRVRADKNASGKMPLKVKKNIFDI